MVYLLNLVIFHSYVNVYRIHMLHVWYIYLHLLSFGWFLGQMLVHIPAWWRIWERPVHRQKMLQKVCYLRSWGGCLAISDDFGSFQAMMFDDWLCGWNHKNGCKHHHVTLGGSSSKIECSCSAGYLMMFGPQFFLVCGVRMCVCVCVCLPLDSVVFF